MTDRQEPVTSKDGGSPKPESPKTKSPGKQGSSPVASADPAAGILPGESQIEADDQEQVIDDGDSAVGTIQTASTSLASSILQYRTLHGRTFHSDQGNANYWMSNDETANEALDIAHHVLTMMLDGKLHLAPLDKNTIQNAVDIGTGTGIWAMDFADEYPNTKVVGTDISPIQPSWVPPNLQFQIDDCTQSWTFEEGSLDYVHLRWLVGSVADWTALMKDAYRSIKPGGYVESHEGSPNITSDDGTVSDTSATAQWGKLFSSGGEKIGRPFTLIENGIISRAMEEAGFVDIVVQNYKCPIGGWAKDPKFSEMGEYMRLAFEQDAEGAVLFVADLQGWSREEIAVYNARLRSELRDKSKHAYFPSQVVYARKPE